MAIQHIFSFNWAFLQHFFEKKLFIFVCITERQLNRGRNKKLAFLWYAINMLLLKQLWIHDEPRRTSNFTQKKKICSFSTSVRYIVYNNIRQISLLRLKFYSADGKKVSIHNLANEVVISDENDWRLTSWSVLRGKLGMKCIMIGRNFIRKRNLDGNFR